MAMSNAKLAYAKIIERMFTRLINTHVSSISLHQDDTTMIIIIKY